MALAGTRTASNTTSEWPCGASSNPNTGSGLRGAGGGRLAAGGMGGRSSRAHPGRSLSQARQGGARAGGMDMPGCTPSQLLPFATPYTPPHLTTVMPGVSMGTSTIDCCACVGAPGSVLPLHGWMVGRIPRSGVRATRSWTGGARQAVARPKRDVCSFPAANPTPAIQLLQPSHMKMATAQRGSLAPDAHHFLKGVQPEAAFSVGRRMVSRCAAAPPHHPTCHASANTQPFNASLRARACH